MPAIKTPKAVILGCQGLELTDDERALFEKSPPLGLILFARNCRAPNQVRSLVAEFRQLVRRPDAPVLIDQEGGRVARLKPPHWPAVPAPGVIVERFAADPQRQKAALKACVQIIAGQLTPLGITVNCAPMADVRAAQAHDGVIGDRALSGDPQTVALLARLMVETYLNHGILPVLKHLPGHGQARVDSHAELPRVESDLVRLYHCDGLPFRHLADCPLGMTAHVVYPALDPERPATLSPTIISKFIRNMLGFKGFLISDDVNMDALTGPVPRRAKAALATGCDVALYCKADPGINAAVLAGVPKLAGMALARWKRAEAYRKVRGAGSPAVSVENAVLALEKLWQI